MSIRSLSIAEGEVPARDWILADNAEVDSTLISLGAEYFKRAGLLEDGKLHTLDNVFFKPDIRNQAAIALLTQEGFVAQQPSTGQITLTPSGVRQALALVFPQVA